MNKALYNNLRNQSNNRKITEKLFTQEDTEKLIEKCGAHTALKHCNNEAVPHSKGQ